MQTFFANLSIINTGIKKKVDILKFGMKFYF